MPEMLPSRQGERGPLPVPGLSPKRMYQVYRWTCDACTYFRVFDGVFTGLRGTPLALLDNGTRLPLGRPESFRAAKW